MENYVVIDGERFDFVKPDKCCSDCDYCALAEWCDWEDTPCSVFNKNGLRGKEMIFVKHENK